MVKYNQEYMFDRGHASMVTVEEEQELKVIYTELFKRGFSLKVENKLILGIGDNDKGSA